MTSDDESLGGGDLATHLGPVFHSDLAAHLKRDAVFVVDVQLDLLVVGRALATDDAAQVRGWLEKGHVRRPTEEERAQWATEAERQFTALPVQPFVLIQVT